MCLLWRFRCGFTVVPYLSLLTLLISPFSSPRYFLSFCIFTCFVFFTVFHFSAPAYEVVALYFVFSLEYPLL